MELSDPLLFRRDFTSDEISTIQEDINRNEQEVESINKDIAVVLSTVEQLRLKRFTHSLHIKRCKAALTLARRLLPELLGKIFEYAANGWARGPFVVSQVCSAWRAAAQSPRVWSRIYVNCDLEDPVGRATFWLEKARHAPLYITVMGSRRANPTHLFRVTNLLLVRAPQWATFTLDLLFLRDTNYVLSRCTPSFPNLRSVVVQGQGAVQMDVDGDVLEINGFERSFSNSPMLKEVQITANLVPVVVPSHISSLWLNFLESPPNRPVSAPALFALLESLPRLKQFRMQMPSEFEHRFISTGESDQVVELPQLESLVLEDIGGLAWIIKHIRAPFLKRLHLRSPEVEDSLPDVEELTGPSLLGFLEASPKLELLEMHHIDIWPEHFASCLALLPELQDLRLHDSDIDDEVIQGLYGRDGACSNLRRIDLRWCHHVRGTTLVELVQSRAPNGFSTNTDGIEEIAALHCSLVRKQDIMHLARLAACRVVVKDENDYCRKLYAIYLLEILC